MMKSLMSSVLRMTSLGPIVASSSCWDQQTESSDRPPRSARGRRGGGVGLRSRGEVRDEELALAIGGPTARGPHQSLAVGAEDGQPVEAFMIGDPLLGTGVHVHQVELVIGVTVPAGRVDDLAAGGMPVRPPVDEFVVGQGPLGGALRVV